MRKLLKYQDKIGHFCACALITLSVWALFGDLILSFLISLFIGTVKELIDDEFDYWDLTADVLGIVYTIILILFVL